MPKCRRYFLALLNWYHTHDGNRNFSDNLAPSALLLEKIDAKTRHIIILFHVKVKINKFVKCLMFLQMEASEPK